MGLINNSIIEKIPKLSKIAHDSITVIMFINNYKLEKLLSELLFWNKLPINEMTPLDFAEFYQEFLKGNPVKFLRIYQEYFGVIE